VLEGRAALESQSGVESRGVLELGWQRGRIRYSEWPTGEQEQADGVGSIGASVQHRTGEVVGWLSASGAVRCRWLGRWASRVGGNDNAVDLAEASMFWLREIECGRTGWGERVLGVKSLTFVRSLADGS
jgi:hypothetical protein